MKKQLVSQRDVVFSNEKIVQIIAGYKANYNRLINRAKTNNEKKALLQARDRFLEKKYQSLLEHNANIIGRRPTNSERATTNIFEMLKKIFSK